MTNPIEQASTIPSAKGDTTFANDELTTPNPTAADPTPLARWLGFIAVLTAGLVAGPIGYGIADLFQLNILAKALCGLFGALSGAIGVGIVVNLTLQAMAEWQTTKGTQN